ncbi:MAG: hypothetical protein Ta2G_06640 [Termitinemataceae bacterium]|nr:MAG: hypothetical protein Ta2G_06640 [Termitinemataceae bacterium]
MNVPVIKKVAFLSFVLLLTVPIASNSDPNISRKDNSKKEKFVPMGTRVNDQFASKVGPLSDKPSSTDPSKADSSTEDKEVERVVLKKPSESILLNSDILAYYGHPVAKNMGILGRYTKEDLTQKLSALADEYKAESGGRNIQKAFYIIYGTAQGKPRVPVLDEEGKEVIDENGKVKTKTVEFQRPSQSILTIDQINKNLLTQWIEFAAENDILIFLDHQIGLLDPIESLKSMFKYLKYPNVHLALDPEWRTDKPMVDFGSVTGEEINAAQQAMQDYMKENNLEGERLLVIHQFREVMIKNRKIIRSDFENIRLVHCMDGVGTPGQKLDTYKFNALATNMPIKAFKLFYDFKLPGVLVDTPLLTPKQVYSLEPRPYIIMYQ